MHKIWQLAKAVKWHRQVRSILSTHLALLEDPTACAFGGLTDEEDAFIANLVQRAAIFDGPIIEFGTLFGVTTRLIAENVRSGQRVVTVDNFSWNPFGLTPALHEAFTRKVLRPELSNSGAVSLCVMDSMVFRSTYHGPVPAMVFFDADHRYEAVRDEIAWAKKSGVPLICGHDYGNIRFGVTRAVDEAFPGGVETSGMVWCYSAAVRPSGKD